MTRDEALKAAESCFERSMSMRLYSAKSEDNQAIALRAAAMAEVGKGYIELAKELRLGQ